MVDESRGSWEALVGPCRLSADVETQLGITGHEMEVMASQRRILRVTTADGTDLYPDFQFAYPGLPEILSLFGEAVIDGWTVVAWLRTPEPELGESPLEALGRGETANVRVVARRAAASLGA